MIALRASDPRETARVIANNPKPVSIVATNSKFCVDGHPAEVGTTYRVDAATAGSLVAVGKAKLA